LRIQHANERFFMGRVPAPIHREKPRATPDGIGSFRSEDGKTSYRLLADTLEFKHGLRAQVLDLACGDGRLVEEIVTVVGPGTGVFGLDMSEDEVARARERYPAATFCVGRAQSLPFGDNSFDAVLSHFAFMLMVPVIPVVSEIERVLRPGGLFACALSSLARAEGDLADVLHLRNEIEATRPPELPTFDPRQATPEGIAELFAEAGSTRQVSVRTVPISCEVDAHGAGRFLDGLYFSTKKCVTRFKRSSLYWPLREAALSAFSKWSRLRR
jgi:SAM-dependent methyltransferase